MHINVPLENSALSAKHRMYVHAFLRSVSDSLTVLLKMMYPLLFLIFCLSLQHLNSLTPSVKYVYSCMLWSSVFDPTVLMSCYFRALSLVVRDILTFVQFAFAFT